jgi:hypothetical protein
MKKWWGPRQDDSNGEVLGWRWIKPATSVAELSRNQTFCLPCRDGAGCERGSSSAMITTLMRLHQSASREDSGGAARSGYIRLATIVVAINTTGCCYTEVRHPLSPLPRLHSSRPYQRKQGRSRRRSFWGGNILGSVVRSGHLTSTGPPFAESENGSTNSRHQRGYFPRSAINRRNQQVDFYVSTRRLRLLRQMVTSNKKTWKENRQQHLDLMASTRSHGREKPSLPSQSAEHCRPMPILMTYRRREVLVLHLPDVAGPQVGEKPSLGPSPVTGDREVKRRRGRCRAKSKRGFPIQTATEPQSAQSESKQLLHVQESR